MRVGYSPCMFLVQKLVLPCFTEAWRKSAWRKSFSSLVSKSSPGVALQLGIRSPFLLQSRSPVPNSSTQSSSPAQSCITESLHFISYPSLRHSNPIDLLLDLFNINRPRQHQQTSSTSTDLVNINTSSTYQPTNQPLSLIPIKPPLTHQIPTS